MSDKSKSIIRMSAVAAVFIVSGLIIVFAQTAPSDRVKPAGATGTAGASAPAKERIAIDLRELSGGKAKFYFKQVSGKKVKFFVVKSSDGVIRAAFDACDVCYRAKKGYRQEGDVMVCNNCGQRFPSVKVNEEKGGCNPSPLERTVEGERVIIAMDALEQGLYLF